MKSINQYLANSDQMYSVTRTRVEEGRGNGVVVYRVTTGGCLQYEVLADNGMDLGSVTYRGHNITFLGKSGLVAPTGYLPLGEEFNHTFNGGLCYTCGLMNVGDPCEDGGESHPLHGRFHFQSADWLSSGVTDECITISGRVREGTLFGENLEVHRSISSPVGSSEIILQDKIYNRNDTEQPFMLLYHCNFGYPFLSPALSIRPPKSTCVTPMDAFSQQQMVRRLQIMEPESERPEEVYAYDLDGDEKTACIQLENSRLKIGVEMRWNSDVLKHMMQWRSMRCGDYVMGIEPGTNYVYGRKRAGQENTLTCIPPYSCIETELRFRFYSLNEESKFG